MSLSSKFFNANFFFGCVVIRQMAALKLNLLKHTSVFLYMKNLAHPDSPIAYGVSTELGQHILNSCFELHDRQS